jgi:hypothetical protein
MSDSISVTLDYAEPWPGAVDDVLEKVYTEAGTAEVFLVARNGPGGGNPVVRVEGSAPAVLEWLLAEYTAGSLRDALELLGYVPAAPGSGSFQPAGS